MLDGFSLEPSHGVSELIRHDAHTVKVGIVEVDLVVGVSPSIANRHSRKFNPRIFHESIVVDQFATKGRDVMSCEGLAGDVEGTALKGWPLAVEIVEEVDQVVCCLVGRTHQWDALVADIREAYSQGLVDENGVPHDVPSLR